MSEAPLSLIQAAILGLIQALTEFLPVSSSGHLVIGQALLEIDSGGGASFEVAVHMGTLLSILVVLRDEVLSLLRGCVLSQHRTSAWREETTFIILSAVPAGLIGVFFKDLLESAFNHLWLVGATLTFTGVILLSTKSRQGARERLTLIDSLLIGLAQAIAILPGVSRSGATISAALWLGIERDRAARLSFLMSLPVVGGAGLLKALDLSTQALSSELVYAMSVGAIISFIIGIFALKAMLKWIIKPSFAYFGVYCLLMGLIILSYSCHLF